MTYPFFERIRSLLDEQNETIEWLTNQLEKSPRWLYNNKILTAISLEEILKISEILKFDFLKDYNEWLAENNKNPISIVSEPPPVYKKEKGLTVELKISGSYSNIGMHFADMLEAIKKQADKYGFTIE